VRMESSTSSQSPTEVGKNRNKKKIGNASVVWSKLCAAPRVVAIDRIRIRAMATITTIAHADCSIQHRFVALFIGIDFIRSSRPSPLLEFLICKFYEVGPVGRGCVAILMLAEGDVTRVDERSHGWEGGCAEALGAQ
jgi:hypothetical protein